jgi:hypothetical protein
MTAIEMAKKSTVLITIFSLLTLASIAVTFNRYILLKDFAIETDEEAFQTYLVEEDYFAEE